MDTQRLDGRPIARKILHATRERLTKISTQHLTLAIISGNDPAAHAYAHSIEHAFRRFPVHVARFSLDNHTTAEMFSQQLEQLNRDPEITAVLILQPLPDHLPHSLPARLLDPIKDIDGITPFHQGQLALGQPAIVPSTPLGALALLRAYAVPLRGRHAVVVGRSTTVGRPLSLLLLTQDATVTICHRQTPDLREHTRTADILLVAAGVPQLITPEHVQAGTIVVDFGIHPRGKEIVGDVAPSVAEVAGAITPVPGGTGPMTTAALAYNFLRLAEWQRTGSLPTLEQFAIFQT